MLPIKFLSSRNGCYLFNILANEIPKAPCHQVSQAVASAIGYLPKLDNKILLLKTQRAYGREHEEI